MTRSVKREIKVTYKCNACLLIHEVVGNESTPIPYGWIRISVEEDNYHQCDDFHFCGGCRMSFYDWKNLREKKTTGAGG